MQRWCVLLLCSLVVLFACDAAEPEATFAGNEPGEESEAPAPSEEQQGDDPDPSEEDEPAPETPDDEDEDESGSDDDEQDPAPSTSSCGSFDLTWPTTASASTQTIVHDAYGPRVRSAGYDWHRGIDLPGDAEDEGFHSPVYAVADASIYAIGNRPNPNQGALSNYSKTAGNVILLEHQAADLHPGAQPLYSVYMHLDTLTLHAFPARVGDDEALVEVDLSEYFYLDGPMANANNRGRRRPTLKSSGEPIDAYPRVHQQDRIATIADTGSTFEHLHFELREGSPYSDDVVNPFAYLPHLDAAMHEATLLSTASGMRARIEIPRTPGSLGASTDLSQQLDVEHIALQLRDAEGELIDELGFEFAELGLFEDADQPSFVLDGAQVTLTPHDFGSNDALWRLDVDFEALAAAGMAPAPGQHYALAVTDVCGNSIHVEL